MIVSGKKTKLTNRRNKLGNADINIRVDEHPLTESKCEKLLGVLVNREGNCKSHLHGDGEKNKGLLLDLSKRIGMLRKLKRNLSTGKFKILVSGIFTSKLLYGITAWGSVWGYDARYQADNHNMMTMRKADMRKLQVLQNSTLRLLLGKRYDTPTYSLLMESKSLSINQTVAYSMISQVWKIRKSEQPRYHYDRLFRRILNPDVNTRSVASEEPRVNFRLSTGRGSFFYHASNLWNNLPADIRDSRTMPRLKKDAKHWIMDNIPMKV